MPPSLQILNGEQGESAQEAALWALIEAQINLTFDAFSFVARGAIKNHDGFLYIHESA